MNLKTVLTSDDAKLKQVDIRKNTFKLFLVILAVYSSYVCTEWLFTHHKKCRQTVSIHRGRKRERVHWYLGVVKSECNFLHCYLRERAQRGCCKWLWRRRCSLKKGTLRTTRRRRRKSGIGRKKPYMESLLGKHQVAGRQFWRWFRNGFIKKGTELILTA